MRYLVLNLEDVRRGGLIKIEATIDDDGIAELKKSGELPTKQPELPLVRLDDESNFIAVPEQFPSGLPNFLDPVD
jgi:hypothetical protein